MPALANVLAWAAALGLCGAASRRDAYAASSSLAWRAHAPRAAGLARLPPSPEALDRVHAVLEQPAAAREAAHPGRAPASRRARQGVLAEVAAARSSEAVVLTGHTEEAGEIEWALQQAGQACSMMWFNQSRPAASDFAVLSLTGSEGCVSAAPGASRVDDAVWLGLFQFEVRRAWMAVRAPAQRTDSRRRIWLLGTPHALALAQRSSSLQAQLHSQAH